MSLHILYHHRTQGRGAEAVHISSIVRALETLGHRVTVVSPPGIDPLDPIQSTPVDKASVHTGGIQSLWKTISRQVPNFLFELAEIGYNLLAYNRLQKILRTQKIDLIYERYAFYLLAGALLARRHSIPFVLEANEVSGISGRARRQSFPRLCAWFERRLFARCAGIHTVSSHLQEMILAQGVDAQRVHVVPNAFDMERVRGRVRRPALIDQFKLHGRVVFGFAGWFDHWDRLDLLFNVFLSLRAKHPQLALLLIGDGPGLGELRQRVATEKLAADVILTGAVARRDVLDFIALLDIAVLPHSNNFGSPVVMFEFMGLGIPVVAPRLGPILDVMQDGQTALLFDPLDAAQCAQAVEKLVTSPGLRRTLSSQALAKLLTEHTWLRNAEKILLAAKLAAPA